LEERDIRDLQENVLAGVVLPVLALRVLTREKYGISIQNLDPSRHSHEPTKESPGTLEEDEKSREGQPVAQHRMLQEHGSTVSTKHAYHREHEQMTKLEDLIALVANEGHAAE
jgi:hypothetical protein